MANQERILVCMHGRAMRILICQLLNKPLTEMDNFFHTNLCLYEFKYQSGDFELLRENFQDHL